MKTWLMSIVKNRKTVAAAVLLLAAMAFHPGSHVSAAPINYVCPNCYSVNVAIIANGASDPSLAATCVKDGIIRLQCWDCDTEWTETDYDNLAKGHSYVQSVVEPTCGTAGKNIFRCSVCGDTYETAGAAATGNHSFSSSVTTPATCTAAGVTTFRCTVCGTSYTQAAPAATGHNYQSAVTQEATCGADGIMTYTCQYCGDSYTEAIEATGDHQYEEEITTPATCVDAGVRTFTCSVCGDSYTEEIEATGAHDYPDEWTVEREATAEKEGLRVKVCAVCGERLEEEIPKLEETSEESSESAAESEAITKAAPEETKGSEEETKESETEEDKKGIPLFIERVGNTIASGYKALNENKTAKWITIAALVLVSFGIIALILRRHFVRKAAEAAAAAAVSGAAGGAGGIPKLSDKTVLTYFGDSKFNRLFLEALKGKSYLAVVAVDAPADDLITVINDEKPDLVIVGVENREVFEEREKDIIRIKGAYKDEVKVAVAADFVSARELKPRYEEMKTAGRIVSYQTDDLSVNTVLNRMILPLYKPELTIDSTVEYIGMIAEAIGLPGISRIVDLYVNGKDIKDTMEMSEKGAVEKATIIADIASILGLDTVASVVNLVNDVDAIRTAADEDAGANDLKEGKNAVKDISDVVEDLIH